MGAAEQIEYSIGGDVAVVFGEVRDYTDAFSSREMQHVARAVAKRRREFSTGRRFAMSAMRSLGLEPQFIEPTKSRGPAWPSGFTGSISHTERLAVVALTRRGRIAGLGVDLELEDRVTEPVIRMALTDAERRALPALERFRSPAAVIFSGKEAVFKAVNPLAGLMIGFEEVELDFDAGRPGRFTAHFIGENQVNRLMDIGDGWFEYYEDHVVTTFVIPG